MHRVGEGGEGGRPTRSAVHVASRAKRETVWEGGGCLGMDIGPSGKALRHGARCHRAARRCATERGVTGLKG